MGVPLPILGSRHRMTQIWFATSTEEYTPGEMLEHAQAAERAGFDALGTSDHWAPWFPDGRGTQAWVYLGAVGQRTKKPIGTGVTPVVHHYHPGAIAQAWMTLGAMSPGRVWLGAGSGEAVNEVPLGLDWPSPAEQLERFDKGLGATRRLWAGEQAGMGGGWRCAGGGAARRGRWTAAGSSCARPSSTRAPRRARACTSRPSGRRPRASR